MTEQSNALRLADWLEDQYDPTHNQEQAAAELRRLVEENQRLRGIVPEVLERLNDELCEENAELRAWFEVESGNSTRRLKKIEEQRDLLLRTLKDCEIALRTVAKDDEDFQMARQQVRDIRAAIKAVEE